jgi:fibronectin type 3 domain-containing protein
MRLSRLVLAVLVPLAACEELTAPATDPDAPANVTYQLIPSGDPATPAGILLTWDLPASGRANSFNVYARSASNAPWNLRATTTSPTFHDAGVPEAQYYVSTRDANGNEIAQSAIVLVDLQTRLPAPQGLTSISLNAAIHLKWSSNAVDASHGTFDYYRVYSTSYDAARGVCTANWSVEGSTATDAFLVGNLTNGTPRCFAVSAISRNGSESTWSEARLDTPRFDARNAFVYSTTFRRDSSGFLFFDDAARKLGVVASAARTDLDFTVERHSDGSLWFAPARSGVTMTLYSTQPVAELTSIDRAPATNFAGVTIEALPGYAYVFRLVKADGVHFAAIRVAFTTPDYIVFDWAYQSAPGNAELSRAPGGE